MERKNDQDVIRKGPWKAEEDEVLINHVKKNGPRDWSSIQSKGLLQRTGKSCRLRWVNKLRPNLKNGSKFSREEERLVIELQAQFGNKWARIATYLPGRTDNDVKNFWSSRQKRLARLLQTSATASKSQKNKRGPICHDLSTLEAPKFSSFSEGESSSKAQSCSSSYIDNSEIIKMVPLPDLVKPQLLSNCETNLAQQEFIPTERYPWIDTYTHSLFPQVLQPLPDLSFSTGSQELLATIDDTNLIDVFGPLYASELGIGAQFPNGQAFSEPVGSCINEERVKTENPTTPESFFDDFPADMFDHIEPPRSPSNF
ncbi:MYB transcription factor [Quillaja saponaria]|uniref:MYB transcription factor n=1 Tax=Quillaja saponaria TaxID=32244 RepID=A0AAD7LQ57_QUISA|nr:MYB transcription factor [Quillaja saponaria]